MIMVESGWRREFEFLEQRFKKMMEQEFFSVRELKALKKLIRSMKYRDKVDWASIHYHFPGKSKELVREVL